MRHRQCTLTTIQHTECNSLYSQYAPLYHGLGYHQNYVQTYATEATAAVASAVDPMHHSTFYAPKTSVSLSHDLQMKYADMLSHQSQYLMKHENVLKTNMHAIDGGLMHGYGDIDSYYYHLEQQRGLVDDLHFRVANGAHYGYHYNPYYGYGHYPYANYPYSESYEHNVKYEQEWGNPYLNAVLNQPAAAPVEEAEEDVAPELTPGEIAGIVIGSVVGCLLLLLLCALARNNMGRSR